MFFTAWPDIPRRGIFDDLLIQAMHRAGCSKEETQRRVAKLERHETANLARVGSTPTPASKSKPEEAL